MATLGTKLSPYVAVEQTQTIPEQHHIATSYSPDGLQPQTLIYSWFYTLEVRHQYASWAMLLRKPQGAYHFHSLYHSLV